MAAAKNILPAERLSTIQMNAGTNTSEYVSRCENSALRAIGSDPRPPDLRTAWNSVCKRKSPVAWHTRNTMNTWAQVTSGGKLAAPADPDCVLVHKVREPRSASAMIVRVGLKPPEDTKTDPSATRSP